MIQNYQTGDDFALESAAEDACFSAAAINRISVDDAKQCEYGYHRCPECPWRNEYTQPAKGDIFKRKDGRTVRILSVNMSHTIEPELQFSVSRHRGRVTRYWRTFDQWEKLKESLVFVRRRTEKERKYFY